MSPCYVFIIYYLFCAQEHDCRYGICVENIYYTSVLVYNTLYLLYNGKNKMYNNGTLSFYNYRVSEYLNDNFT